MKELNSNNSETTIHYVCSDCWIEASKLTWKNKFPWAREPEKYSFDVSTFHKWNCDFCKKEKSITQTRDFFYPDFNLLQEDYGQ